MDLEVIGRHALLFDDDSMAAFVNSPEALVDWNSLSIDRYDVRHLLSSPPPPRNRHLRRNNHRPLSSNTDTDDTLEADIDHERYLDLTSSSDHEQGTNFVTKVSSFRVPNLENEAAVENAGGYRAVPFSYGAPSELSEQKSIDAESSFCPPFTLPEHLHQNMPLTEKVHQIIARTATFVSKHGGQSEIVLRVKQGDNPTFGFLLPDHNLHPYFRFLVDHQQLLKSDNDRKLIKEESKFDGGLDQVGSALSLLGSVYGSGEDEEGGTEDALAPTKNDLKEAADADNVTVSHGLEENNLSQNAAGKDEVLSKPPFPPLKERSHVIKRNHPISTFKSGSTSRVKKDGDSMSSVSSTVNKLQPPICPSLSKVEPSVLEPPSDLKRVVDKIVEFILRNGKEFEAVLVQQDTKHGRFPFLLPSNQYHPYYLKALQKAQESRIAGKNFISEKHEHGIEKKSGNKESDTVSLGSDIPCEYDRKEKFKMVIGKPKKDEKNPSSKATQPQVGVSVDAAAAAAILQAATKGIKNPSFEILSKTINSNGQGPSSEGGRLPLSWSQSSNQKPDENEEPGVSGTVAKAVAKTAALVVASEADSSEASLTREEKLKAERLKRAKMFAAMIRTGAAPVKSESLRGLSVEPPESGLSGSDSYAVHLVGRERESNSAPMEIDTCDKIEKAEKKESADEQNERRSKRSYRSRPNRAEEEREEEEEEEEEEGEDLKEDRDHKHSRKKRRSHRSSHHSRDRHKHRKKHSSSPERESEHRHEQDSTSEDEYRHSRRRHRHEHGSSSDYEHRHSSRRHRHDSSPSDEHRHTRRRHKHRGSSDDEQMHTRRSRRYDSSDDEHRHRHSRSQHQCKHGSSSDDEDRYQAKSVKHRKMSRSEREAELEEGEILTKSDQSKVSEGEDGASREPSVDLSKSSQRSETAEISNDLRAKIRAMLMATL